MRKIREALRLRFEEKRSLKAIATSLNIGETTVSDLLARAAAAGVGVSTRVAGCGAFRERPDWMSRRRIWVNALKPVWNLERCTKSA